MGKLSANTSLYLQVTDAIDNNDNLDAAIKLLQDLFYKYPLDSEDLFGEEQFFLYSFYNTPVFMLFFAQVRRLRLDLNTHVKFRDGMLPAFVRYLSSFYCEPGIIALWLILGANPEICRKYLKNSHLFSKFYADNMALLEKLWPQCQPIQQLLASVDKRLENLSALNEAERLALFNDIVLLTNDLKKLKQRPDLVIKRPPSLKCLEYGVVKQAIEKFYDDLHESFASKLFMVFPYATFTKDYHNLRDLLIMATQAKAAGNQKEAFDLFNGIRSSLKSLSKNIGCNAAADLAALDRVIKSLEPTAPELPCKGFFQSYFFDSHTETEFANTSTSSSQTNSVQSSVHSSPGSSPPSDSVLRKRHPHYQEPADEEEKKPLLDRNSRFGQMRV